MDETDYQDYHSTDNSIYKKLIKKLEQENKNLKNKLNQNQFRINKEEVMKEQIDKLMQDLEDQKEFSIRVIRKRNAWKRKYKNLIRRSLCGKELVAPLY